MLRKIESASDWQQLLSGFSNPHVLQSWEWGEVKGQTGWSPLRYVLEDAQGRVVGAFQLLLRRAPARLPFTIGYIPKGPIVDWTDSGVPGAELPAGRLQEPVLDVILDSIQQVAQRERCLFVKIDPNVDEESETGRQLLETLRARGWVFSQEQIQFKNTAISELWVAPDQGADTEQIDAEQIDAELLTQMKSKWRYNIRLAERRGVTIRSGTPDDFADFYQLYASTSQRDNFAIRPFDYYKTVWRTFWRAQQDLDNASGGVLLLAEHPDEGQPLAGVFLMRYGETVWYFYGASSERRRRDMPNYLLQWRALQWANREGSTVYDWWGAPTDLSDPNDRMAGVWRFKQGFGARFQSHIGAWDWSPWPFVYRAYLALKPLIQRIG